MAKNYSITFKSLRAGTVYTLNIGGGTGAAVPLKGGAQPFVTQEDDDDDQFTPIRTQSGSIRIVDDCRDADGNLINPSAPEDWWKDLVPQTNLSRPVTLTHTENDTTITDWQGFMQAQNFSGVLYGNPQEREFPVHCVLSALNGVDIPTTVPTGMQMILNFASLLGYIFGNVPTLSNNLLSNGEIVFQCASRAQTILGAKIDWSNFLTTDEEGNAAASYTLYQILEDFCRFWGYTVRTYRKDIIFTCCDDTTETSGIRFASESDLASITGTTDTDMYTTVAVPDSFVSADNDDTVILGPGKAEVKADTNSQKEVVEFAPYEIEKQMENTSPGYTWVADEEASDGLTGYFTTPYIYSFDCPTLEGTGKFCRRQIFTSAEQNDGTNADLICITGLLGDTIITRMQTKTPRAYGGGTIRMHGQFFIGAKAYPYDNDNMYMRLGIGMDRESAKWLKFGVSGNMVEATWVSAYDGGNSPKFLAHMANDIGPCILSEETFYIPFFYPAIPVAADLYGYLFIEFWGGHDGWSTATFEIANFNLEFSREVTVLPQSSDAKRGRTMADKRKSTIRYAATNNNGNLDKWNADCIFASDNNAEYGYGLLMTASGGYLGQLTYGSVQKYPEQHLVDRVSAYYATAKRMITGSLDSNAQAIASISPRNMATLDGSTFHPIAISHEWRDDATILTLLQM